VAAQRAATGNESEMIRGLQQHATATCDRPTDGQRAEYEQRRKRALDDGDSVFDDLYATAFVPMAGYRRR
jgi:hypothetical protein